MKRIDVAGDDFSALFDVLKDQFGPNQRDLQDLTRKVWLGEFPLALIAEVGSRSYTEVLVKQTIGCYVAAGELHDADVRRGHAGNAFGGSIVADLSALVIGPKLGVARNELLAFFSKVHFPSSLSDDVDLGQLSLSMRSTATMGWNDTAGRPTLTEYSAEQVEQWAKDVSSLQSDVRSLSVVKDVVDPQLSKWNSALLLAKELGRPLWVDDVSIQRIARELGVDSFGTIDLLFEAHQREIYSVPSPQTVLGAAMGARVVDMLIQEDWWRLGSRERWEPSGYLALAVSRPSAWADFATGWKQYQALIRHLPLDAEPTEIASWAASAGRGMALSVPAGGRPRAVGALLAWTALNRDPMFTARKLVTSNFTNPSEGAVVLRELLAVGDMLQEVYFDAGDILVQVVEVIAGALLSILDAADGSRFIVSALSTLNEEHRSRALAAFLAASAAK